jgi:hypothetical protein
MATVASQWIEEVTAHAQSDSLEDAREICADGTYFPNNLHTFFYHWPYMLTYRILIDFTNYNELLPNLFKQGQGSEHELLKHR